MSFGSAIQSVAGLRSPCRSEQPDLVIMMQRAHADPGHFGQLADGVVGHFRRHGVSLNYDVA